MLRNIKTKLLFWYSITIILILSIFSKIILNEFTKLVHEKENHITTSIEHLENVLIIWIPMLLIASILVGYFIIKNSLIPVKKVIDEVKNIENLNLVQKLTRTNSNDEIDELITTFNFMLDKLHESFSKIKRFSNDVSHELKTPLTIIRGEIELGLRKDRTNNEYKNILKSTLEETKALQDLIDSLLFLSKANNKDIQNKFELIDLDEIITDVISQNKYLIKNKEIQFEFKRFDSVNCQGHPLLLKILIGNIIQNAIKYSYQNSKIDIYLNDNVLQIKDYGIGIQKKDLKYIFDRFYRVNQSRDDSGYGLGLSIVKLIIQIHNFDIEVKSQYNKCTQFTIKL
jgi:signal transduction histidine kinase